MGGTPPARYQALALMEGGRYHSNTMFPHRTLIFLRWEQRRCQLHGDKLGWNAVFQTVKASGKHGALAAFDPLMYPVEPSAMPTDGDTDGDQAKA
jgi:hypothetical protein